MIPKHHAILGAIISLALYFLTPINLTQTIIILLSSVLIDADHYFYYVFKKKSFNFLKARKWFFKKRKIWISMPLKKREKFKRPILIFHGIEFWFFLILLAQLHSIFYFILIGIAIHIFCDYIDIIQNKDKFYSKFSQIYVYLSNKDKRKHQTSF